MVSFKEGGVFANEFISAGTVVIAEEPLLRVPDNIPVVWKKLAKKVSKLEADKKPNDVVETMPTWSQVTLNEAIVKLLCAYNDASEDVRSKVLEIYNPLDSTTDSPFDSLMKKAKVVITKEAPKVGISKKVLTQLDQVLRVLVSKVCVTVDGGAILFHKLGRIPHSCAPNCMFIPRGVAEGRLVAIRDISPDEPLNCSHIPTNCLRASTEQRQSWLRGVAGSKCRSSCCVGGFDLRRRVVCARCHPVEERKNDDFARSDQSNMCFAANKNGTNSWIGLKCGLEISESEAIDLAKEAAMVRKIYFLNDSVDMEFTRLMLLTKTALSDSLKLFGKGHFAYQQLLLLEIGLVLHSMTGTVSSVAMEAQFNMWMKMLVDVVNYSVDTHLPFDGMDELVRVLLTPDTLQMMTRFLASVHREQLGYQETTVAMLSLFSDFLNRAFECLSLIEGSESVHVSDGLKLKNWWVKKLKSWMIAPRPVLVEDVKDSMQDTQLPVDSQAATPSTQAGGCEIGGSLLAEPSLSPTMSSKSSRTAIVAAVGSALVVGSIVAIALLRKRK